MVPQNPTGRREWRDAARQAGAAAQAIRLNTELVRSRAGTVTAREEERRLRRDLHDGLGPILAGQALKMAAVRRLACGLRPPVLDELGLAEAVRDVIHRSRPGSEQPARVEGPEAGLPELPDAGGMEIS